MRKKDKELKEYREQWQSLTYMIESGVPGSYEDLRNDLETEATNKGYTLAQLRGTGVEDIVHTTGYIRNYMKQLYETIEDDRDAWVVYKKCQVSIMYNFIRTFHDGEYILLKGKTIKGKPRLDFIMEALEANKKKIEHRIPSCGYGKVEHIVPRDEFVGKLDDVLYDSPLNLQRVPAGEIILAMRTRGLRVEFRYFSKYEQLAELPELQKYSRTYIRQAVREERQVAGWSLGRISNVFDTEELETIVEENRLLMEDLGWLK